mmetsp:Transcript_2394/g.7041  ORF Transcript_2394/g.7041 Transcript_2394/m.7041 type:complete len:211 (-) Transcript_2394:317-949(-)
MLHDARHCGFPSGVILRLTSKRLVCNACYGDHVPLQVIELRKWNFQVCDTLREVTSRASNLWEFSCELFECLNAQDVHLHRSPRFELAPPLPSAQPQCKLGHPRVLFRNIFLEVIAGVPDCAPDRDEGRLCNFALLENVLARRDGLLLHDTVRELNRCRFMARLHDVEKNVTVHRPPEDLVAQLHGQTFGKKLQALDVRLRDLHAQLPPP